MVGFVRSLASGIDGVAHAADICISAICPGFTDTNNIDEGVREFVAELGLEIMPTDHAAEVVAHVLREWVHGAQWVVWPGVDPHVYEWNPAIRPDELDTE